MKKEETPDYLSKIDLIKLLPDHKFNRNSSKMKIYRQGTQILLFFVNPDETAKYLTEKIITKHSTEVTEQILDRLETLSVEFEKTDLKQIIKINANNKSASIMRDPYISDIIEIAKNAKTTYFETLVCLVNEYFHIIPDSILELIFTRYERISYEMLSKEKTEYQKDLFSYSWKQNDKLLMRLFDLMKDEFMLITSNNVFNDFKAAFSHKKCGDFQGIKWRSNQINELLYFLQQLMKDSIYIDDEFKRLNLIRLKSCFKNSDGSEFTQNISAIKSQLVHLSPDKQDNIDKLMSKLKTL